MKTYTKSQMLEIWRRNAGLSTRRPDCSVEVYEGIDFDDILVREMRRWYLGVLDTAPVAQVPVRNFAFDATLLSDVKLSPPRSLAVMPGNARRPLSVRLDTWLTDAVPVTPEEARTRLERLASPYSAPGPRTPLAVIVPEGLMLFPAGNLLRSLMAVSDPGPDEYVLDEALLPPPSRNLSNL